MLVYEIQFELLTWDTYRLHQRDRRFLRLLDTVKIRVGIKEWPISRCASMAGEDLGPGRLEKSSDIM